MNFKCINGEIEEDPEFTTTTSTTTKITPTNRFKLDQNCDKIDQMCCRRKTIVKPVSAKIIDYKTCGLRRTNDQLRSRYLEDEIGRRVINNSEDQDQNENRKCVVGECFTKLYEKTFISDQITEKFPWTVAIFRSKTSERSNIPSLIQYTCGGSLIHPKVVLTCKFKNRSSQTFH